MGWKTIAKFTLSVVKFIENHWLLSGAMGLIIGHFLDIPQIVTGAIIFVMFTALLAVADFLFSSKLHRYMAYNVIFIIYVLTVPFCWEWLVNLCDRDNPYKKPLLTGEGRIEITVEPNGDMGGGLKSFAGWGCILLVKDNNEIILNMGGVAGREQIENGRWVFFVLPTVDASDESINKPVNYLTKAKFAVIEFERLPPNSRIIDGNASLSFNSSVQFKIPTIPPQIMTGHDIIIKDVQKYFKKRK